MKKNRHFIANIAVSVLLMGLGSAAQAVDLEFYFPVAVGGKAAEMLSMQVRTETPLQRH